MAEEPGAWKDFVDRFMRLFVHVIQHTAHSRSVRLSQDDIDDLCADVFVGILADKYAVLRRFRGKSSLATYLTVVARRIVVHQISRRRMAEALGHVEAHGTSLAQADAVVPHRVLDDREEIAQLLQELPPRDAAAVRMCHLENRSYAEIAAELQIPENSVGPLLTRARQKLNEKREVRS